MMSKVRMPVLTLNLLFLGLVAKLFEAIESKIESKIPLGYEDKTGFHYGVRR
jgi:hypothetical protein